MKIGNPLVVLKLVVNYLFLKGFSMPISYKKGWHYLKITVNGKRFTPKMVGMEPARFKTRTEAKKAEAQLRVLAEQHNPTLTAITLLQLCNLYLDAMQNQVNGKDTFSQKRRFCEELLVNLGDMVVTEVKVHHAQTILNKRAEEVSTHSYNRYRKEGVHLWNWAKSQQLTPLDSINVFQAIKKIPQSKPEPKPAPIEAVITVMLIANQSQQELLKGYLYTGARKQELLKMVWSDIDFEKRTYLLHTRKSGNKELKTTKHEMSEALYQLFIERWDQRHPDLPYVYWHRYYSRPHKSYIEDRYQDLNGFTKKLCEKAEVEPHFTLHQLRHLATSILKQHGMSIAQLQLFLRHDEQRTTERYAGHLDTNTQAQADVLGDFWTSKFEEINQVDSPIENKEIQPATKTSTKSRPRLYVVKKNAA